MRKVKKVLGRGCESRDRRTSHHKVIGVIGVYLSGLTHRQGHQIAQKRQGLPGAKGDTESHKQTTINSEQRAKVEVAV